MLYYCNIIILSNDVISLMSACKVHVHFIMMTTSLEREDGCFILMMSSTLASWSVEDNGKDGIFRLCLQLPSSHTVFHMNWCVNTGGLTGCLLCRDCAAPLLPLTLPPLLSLFSIQRGTSASMPTPNTAGSASRPEPNVAGVKTQYVNRSCQL